MNARVVTSLVLLILCGCHTPPTGAPTDLGDGFRREGHPAFTPKEQAVVVATREAIEKSCRRRIDAYYRVRHTWEAYSVLVFEVYRYVRRKPTFTIGRDWGVDLKEDGTVTRVDHLNM